MLLNKSTACLAEDQCGIPQGKAKNETLKFQSNKQQYSRWIVVN
jgi:hypothetical protein